MEPSRRRQRVVKASSVPVQAPAQLPIPQPSSASSAIRIAINSHEWHPVALDLNEGPVEVRSDGGLLGLALTEYRQLYSRARRGCAFARLPWSICAPLQIQLQS
jgi:hypothetical protein